MREMAVAGCSEMSAEDAVPALYDIFFLFFGLFFGFGATELLNQVLLFVALLNFSLFVVLSHQQYNNSIQIAREATLAQLVTLGWVTYLNVGLISKKI